MLFTPWPLRGLTLKALDLPGQIQFYNPFGFARTHPPAASTSPCNRRPSPTTACSLRRPLALRHSHTRSSDSRFIPPPCSRHKSNFVGDLLVSNALYFSGSNTTASKCTPTAPTTAGNGPATASTWVPLDLGELAAFPDAGPTEEWTGFPLADENVRHTIGIGGVATHSPLSHHPAGPHREFRKIEPWWAGGSLRRSPPGLRRSTGSVSASPSSESAKLSRAGALPPMRPTRYCSRLRFGPSSLA